MKVKLLDDVQVPTGIRGGNVVHTAPAEIEVDDAVGERFVRIGVAVEVKVAATKKG